MSSPAKFHDDFDQHHHQRSIRNMREINGPRPHPLKINKDSYVIQKQQQHQQKQPVVIYEHSPKVIHTQPRDFMALVQKLTGSAGHETATNKKTIKKLSHDDHDNDLSRGVGVGDCGANSSSISPITKAPTYQFLAEMPLFTPTSTDNFFCLPRPMFRFPETNNTCNPISPSLVEFMKGLPEC